MLQTRQTRVTWHQTCPPEMGNPRNVGERTEALRRRTLGPAHCQPPRCHRRLASTLSDAYACRLPHQQSVKTLASGGNPCAGCIRQCIKASCCRHLPVPVVLSPTADIPPASHRPPVAFICPGGGSRRFRLALREVDRIPRRKTSPMAGPPRSMQNKVSPTTIRPLPHRPLALRNRRILGRMARGYAGP